MFMTRILANCRKLCPGILTIKLPKIDKISQKNMKITINFLNFSVYCCLIYGQQHIKRIATSKERLFFKSKFNLYD